MATFGTAGGFRTKQQADSGEGSWSLGLTAMSARQPCPGSLVEICAGPASQHGFGFCWEGAELLERWQGQMVSDLAVQVLGLILTS